MPNVPFIPLWGTVIFLASWLPAMGSSHLPTGLGLAQPQGTPRHSCLGPAALPVPNQRALGSWPHWWNMHGPWGFIPGFPLSGAHKAHWDAHSQHHLPCEFLDDPHPVATSRYTSVLKCSSIGLGGLASTSAFSAPRGNEPSWFHPCLSVLRNIPSLQLAVRSTFRFSLVASVAGCICPASLDMPAIRGSAAAGECLVLFLVPGHVSPVPQLLGSY